MQTMLEPGAPQNQAAMTGVNFRNQQQIAAGQS